MRKRRCGPAFVLTRRPYGRVRQLASPALPARYVATTCRTTSNPPDDPEPRPCFAPASCCPPLSRAAWPDPALATRHLFPGVSLAAIRFLHEQRHILFHGHEPLDTDTTATLEGEGWLLNRGYTQAAGVANLDQVPETGALVTMGFPKFQGGVGGYARFIAICPPDWK